MSGKPRSAAQLQFNQNRRNAGATLKSKGRKANITTVAALVKHRREGKSNDEFFGTNAVVTNAVVRTTSNTTARKPRTIAQAAANQRRSNAIAALKEHGLKANAASVKRYLNASGAAGGPAKVNTEPLMAIEEEELLSNSSPAAVVMTNTKPSGHVAAGKKAATSEKGAAWLRNVNSAKTALNSAYRNANITRKSTRANAMKYAKALRDTPESANNVMMNILATAQGNAFNKNNKTAKKSTKKRNNGLNRVTRNFVNRRRNRLTRKPIRNYGTMKQTKRNTNNRYRPYNGNNNNNFNIKELRNAPF